MNQSEFEKYLDGHLKQIAREEEELQKLAGEAMKKANMIASKLAETFNISKMYLFGSLAWGSFQIDSDIDLAVEGLPEELFLMAYGVAENIAGSFKIDMVLLENAVPSLRERVIEEGTVIYDLRGEKDCPPEKAGC